MGEYEHVHMEEHEMAQVTWGVTPSGAVTGAAEYHSDTPMVAYICCCGVVHSGRSGQAVITVSVPTVEGVLTAPFIVGVGWGASLYGEEEIDDEDPPPDGTDGVSGGALYAMAYSFDSSEEGIDDENLDTVTDMATDSMEYGTTNTTNSGITTTTVTNYAYDGFNRLIGVTDSTGLSAQYTYRPDGLRASKTVNGVRTAHVWNGQNLVLDIDGSTVRGTYVRGIGLIRSTIASTTSWYLHNAHGDVVQLANQSGTVTRNYDYDAFGVERNPVANDTNPFRYCGECYDQETNAY